MAAGQELCRPEEGEVEEVCPSFAVLCFLSFLGGADDFCQYLMVFPPCLTFWMIGLCLPPLA